LNDASAQWPFRFTVTFTDGELRTYRKLMARRLAQSANSSAKWVLIVAYPLAIGLVVLGAFKLGWIAIAELPSVSLTAFVAFNAGILVYYFYLRHFYLKLYRADGRGGTWSYCFDDAGIVYAKEGRLEVRLTWRAVDSVEDTGSMVLFRFSLQGLSIPARIFANDAARTAFVTATAARIKAAAESAGP
jgi:hypothetical protein